MPMLKWYLFEGYELTLDFGFGFFHPSSKLTIQPSGLPKKGLKPINSESVIRNPHLEDQLRGQLCPFNSCEIEGDKCRGKGDNKTLRNVSVKNASKHSSPRFST
jgi:hypothetical protein